MKTKKTMKTKKNKFRNDGRKKPRNHSKNRKTYKKYKTHTLKGSGNESKSNSVILEKTKSLFRPALNALAQADKVITAKSDRLGRGIRRNFKRFVPKAQELYGNPNHKKKNIDINHVNVPVNDPVTNHATDPKPVDTYFANMKSSKLLFSRIIKDKNVEIFNYKPIFPDIYKDYVVNIGDKSDEYDKYDEYDILIKEALDSVKNKNDDVSLENIKTKLEESPDNIVFYYKNNLILLTTQILKTIIHNVNNIYYDCKGNYDTNNVTFDDDNNRRVLLEDDKDVEDDKDEKYPTIVNGYNTQYIYTDLTIDSHEFKFLLPLPSLYYITAHNIMVHNDKERLRCFEIKDSDYSLSDLTIKYTATESVCEELKDIPNKTYEILYIDLNK